MRPEEARALLAAAVSPGERWADLGAGTGTFSTALSALLGPAGSVVAVDRDAGALARVRSAPGGAAVSTLVADFAGPLALPSQDGLLLANSLHFAADQRGVLAGVLPLLTPGGKLLVLEYDESRASGWVPYPLPFTALVRLATALGLTAPRCIAQQPSRFRAAPIYAALLRV